MRIGIDARLYGLEHTGIGRYVMELVHHLLKLDSSNDYVLFLATEDIRRLPKSKNVTLVPADIRHYSLNEQIAFPKLIHRHLLDFIHIPHFNVPLALKIPFIVTIHDLLWHEVMGYNVTTLNPLMYSLKYLGYRLVVRKAVKRSQIIITPSNWVKTQVLKRFNIAEEKVAVVYEGVGHSFSRRATAIAKTDFLRSFSIKKPFVVYTGSLYPHKNLKTLIKALKVINNSGSLKISLVIVSARSNFLHQLRQFAYKHDQEHYVQFVGFLSDAELVRIYQQALALVHPSTSEGFGLTGLEGMAAGLPIIASQAASLPEIYQQAALYFNPKSARDLAQKILKLFSNKPLRQTLIKKGKAQVKKYSWNKMTQATLKIYQQMQVVKS